MNNPIKVTIKSRTSIIIERFSRVFLFICALIARAAQAGVQVVVETHSNHVINGILMASKRYENGESGVDRKLVKMYYMKRHTDGLYSDFEEVRIIGDGKIDHQPDGFFSRMDSDMAYLLGF